MWIELLPIFFLTFSFDFNYFTVKGVEQLQQAAEERNSYSDFVKLDIYQKYEYS